MEEHYSWLRKVLGNNKKMEEVIANVVVARRYESKYDVLNLNDIELTNMGFREGDIERLRSDDSSARQQERASTTVTNHAPVGAQASISGSIVIGSLTQGVTNILLKSGQEIESAKEALKRRQESACQDLGRLIFLGVDFMEQMQKACEATVSICAFEGNKIVGTGFVVGSGCYVMTCMHNITLDTSIRSYKEKVTDWKVASSTDWPDLESCKVEFAEKRFIVAGFKSGDVMALRAGIKKLEFLPHSIILLPQLDVAIIKIENAKELKLPSVHVDENLGVKTGERDAEARCFIVGHPQLSVSRPIDQKVVSMQLHNFLRRVEGSFVQYFTDTERGFSGGPVLVWAQHRLVAVAVHHTGQTLNEFELDDLMIRNHLCGYNEGTLLSSVLVEVEKHHPHIRQHLIDIK